MVVLFNKYHRILIDLLVLFLFLGLSIHPFFVEEVSYLLVFVKYFARLGLLLYSLKLGYSVFSNIRVNKIAWFLFAVMLLIIFISIAGILIHDIEVYSSILVVLIFCFVFLIFYSLLFDNRMIIVDPLLVKYKSTDMKRVLTVLTWVLLLSMILEICIKFIPSNRMLYNYLRDDGVIAFAFRLCGFMLDANRWALTLLFTIFIYRNIFIKYSFKSKISLYILGFYLIFTLSKTAFFIFLFIMLIEVWSMLLKIRLKTVFSFFSIIIVTVVVLNQTGYEFENSGLQRRLIFTIESVLNPTNSYTVNERKETYNDAFTAIKQHPISGVGYLNFTANTASSGALTIHNTFLALLTYFGLIFGPIIYVFLFILPFILLASKYGPSKQLLELFIISFIFMNLLSVAHDMVLILIFYITLIVFEITSKIKHLKN